MEILVKVNPSSKKININEFGYDELTNLKIYKVNLTAKPINGSANKQLKKVLSDYFDVKENKIVIDKGKTSKFKKVKLD